MASTAPPTRLVICPKCRNVLPEAADAPLYQCAVCDTILLAKNFRERATSIASVDSVFNFTHINEFDHGSETCSMHSNGESETFGADPAHSPDSENIFNSDDGCHKTGESLRNGAGNQQEIGDQASKSEDHSHSTDAGSKSNTEDGCHASRQNLRNGGNGPTSGSEDSDEVTGPLSEQMTQTLYIGKQESETKDDPIRCVESEIGDDDDRCLDEKLEMNLNLGKDDTNTPYSEDEKVEFVKSTCQKSIPGENSVDGDNKLSASSRVTSPVNVGSPKGSVSSIDSRYLEKNSGVQGKLQSRRTFRPRSVPGSPQSDHVMRRVVSQAGLEETALVTEQLKVKCGSDVMGSFDSTESSSSRSKNSHGREASTISEELLQIGRNDGSLSKFRDIDYSHIELLRKVDELRFQLIGSLDQRSDVDGKSEMMGRRQILHPSQPLKFRSQGSDHEFLVPSHPALLSKHPFYCLNCHAPHLRGTFCNSGLCLSCCQIYCHPSETASYHSNVVCSPLSSCQIPTHDNFRKRHIKMKDQTMKRHCRPISGGANLIICPECLELLQMPDDFPISRKKSNKLRCGSCSQVLTLSFPKKRFDSHNFEGNSGASLFSNFDDGHSSSGSYIMENEQVHNLPNNYIDSKEEMHKKQHPRLHRLMGYVSASDILYDGENSEY